mgnify:CR=1 FL=1
MEQEEVVCKKGKCEYRDSALNEEWREECADCDEIEKIEHELSKKARPR